MSRAESKTLTLRQALELGRERFESGDLAGARQVCSQVLKAQPELGTALHLMGLIEYQEGDKSTGVALLERAAERAPEDLQLKINLARMLQKLGRAAEAVTLAEAALRLDPKSAAARDMALTSYRVLARREHNKSRLAASMRAARRALELGPDDAKAHFQYAESLLLAGLLDRGFAEYEWRWKIEDFPNKPQKLGPPLWDGGPLDGKTILLHPEQGLGDSIQFCRYVPLLAERGAKVVMAVGPALHRLFGSLEGLAGMIGLKERLPDFDCHAPIMSLPHLFGTTLETIPGGRPYLTPPADAVARWSERFAGLSGLRIGVAWGGSAKHPNDKRRSIDPALLRPLVVLPGTSWVSLQTAERRAELAVFEGLELLDITDELGDFAETAAIAANLDLVLCVDTALGHAAGATGTPAWLMLSQPSDWRWMIGSSDTPWYHGHRLFRQPVRDDWPPVIEALKRALTEEAEAKRA